MALNDIIAQGWARHDKETAEVSTELEAAVELIEPTDADGAAGFMNLASHTIGDHGEDRARAMRLCEAALARLSDYGNKSPWLQVAVARHLAGEEEAAQAAENELGETATGQVRVRLLVAQGKSHEGDWESAAALYNDCVHVAESLEEGHEAERAVAVVSNNLASALLNVEGRSATQDELMERAALTARKYWLRIGDWTHDERADYLLALACNELGRAEEAREFARRALKTIATNGEQAVDQAFLELAQAKACKMLGDKDGHELAILRAQALSDEFGNEDLFRWFESTLAKVK